MIAFYSTFPHCMCVLSDGNIYVSKNWFHETFSIECKFLVFRLCLRYLPSFIDWLKVVSWMSKIAITMSSLPSTFSAIAVPSVHSKIDTIRLATTPISFANFADLIRQEWDAKIVIHMRTILERYFVFKKRVTLPSWLKKPSSKATLSLTITN